MTGHHPECFDVIIVGAGPAGLSSALAAKQNNLSYLVIESENIAQTIRNYPKGKAFFNKPNEQITFFPHEKIINPTRETVLENWENTVSQNSLHIHIFEKLLNLQKKEQKILLETNQNKYLTKNVILAFGNMGQPRWLNLEGEDLPHVFHRLKDPTKFKDKTCLVIGGGDTAAEAALALQKNSANVAISYRKDKFTRLKPNNLEAIENSPIKIFFKSNALKFLPQKTILKDLKNKEFVFSNDFVFVLCGTVFPSAFSQKINLATDENGEILYNPKTLETKFSNVYLAGSLTKQKLIPDAIKQGNFVISQILQNK